MKKRKKLLSILLSAGMLISATSLATLPLAMSAGAVESSTADGVTTYAVTSIADLNDALTEIRATTNSKYVLDLQADLVDMTGITVSGEGNEVTIVGNDHSIEFKYYYQGYRVSVSDGATVNLGDGNSSLTFVGKTYNDGPGIVEVKGDGTVCNMYDGVTLKDNETQNYYGGGVTVIQGTFHMYGGVIENCGVRSGGMCYGGGVGINYGGQFIMDEGTIRNCYVKSDYYTANTWQIPTIAGGGVFVYRGSSFVMNGGTIENCAATGLTDTNPSAIGGGVAAVTSYYSVLDNSKQWGHLDASVVINDGEIKNCSAELGGALFAGGGYLRIPPLANPDFDVVANPNPFGITINGGTFDSNTATEGAGLFFNWVRPHSNIKNAVITNNVATESGGAIEIAANYTNIDFENCTITDNVAQNGVGGAMLVFSNADSAGTTFTDCVICNNLAGEAGSDFYIEDENCQVTLCDASAMNEVYTGLPDSLTGKNVTDWYNDEDGARFVTLDAADRVRVSPAALVGPKALIVSSSPEYLTDVTLKKDYLDGYDNTKTITPGEDTVQEDIQFTVTALTSFNREVTSLTDQTLRTDMPDFDPGTYTITADDGVDDNVTVALPDFSTYGVGDYWYEVKETAGTTAGVTYDANTYYMHLVVTRDDPDAVGVTQVTIHKTAPNDDGTFTNDADDKVDPFTNEYANGELTIEKKVAGNMGDKNKLFEVTVALTAPEGTIVKGDVTYNGGFNADGTAITNAVIDAGDDGWTGTKTFTVYMKDGATVEITNLPDGMAYEVVETDYSGDNYEMPKFKFENADEGDIASASEDAWELNKANGTISDYVDVLTITNTKNSSIDVGVIIEYTPYILLIGIATLGGVMLIFKRRRDADEA